MRNFSATSTCLSRTSISCSHPRRCSLHRHTRSSTSLTSPSRLVSDASRSASCRCARVLQQRPGSTAGVTEHGYQLVTDECCYGAAHRDPCGIAIAFPRRSLRRSHRDPHHPEPLVSVEPGQEPPVEPHHGQGPSQPPMSTCRRRATCCRCVCDWRVVGANRDPWRCQAGSVRR